MSQQIKLPSYIRTKRVFRRAVACTILALSLGAYASGVRQLNQFASEQAKSSQTILKEGIQAWGLFNSLQPSVCLGFFKSNLSAKNNKVKLKIEGEIPIAIPGVRDSSKINLQAGFSNYHHMEDLLFEIRSGSSLLKMYTGDLYENKNKLPSNKQASAQLTAEFHQGTFSKEFSLKQPGLVFLKPQSNKVWQLELPSNLVNNFTGNLDLNSIMGISAIEIDLAQIESCKPEKLQDLNFNNEKFLKLFRNIPR